MNVIYDKYGNVFDMETAQGRIDYERRHQPQKYIDWWNWLKDPGCPLRHVVLEMEDCDGR